MQKFCSLVIFYCRYHCFHDNSNPFIFSDLLWLQITESYNRILWRAFLPSSTSLMFPRSKLQQKLGYHTAFDKKSCRVWCIIWYSNRVLWFLNRDDFEVRELVFLKNFKARISRIKKYFSLIFTAKFSKWVSAYNRTFQFNKCGFLYGLPISELLK